MKSLRHSILAASLLVIACRNGDVIASSDGDSNSIPATGQKDLSVNARKLRQGMGFKEVQQILHTHWLGGGSKERHHYIFSAVGSRYNVVCYVEYPEDYSFYYDNYDGKLIEWEVVDTAKATDAKKNRREAEQAAPSNDDKSSE